MEVVILKASFIQIQKKKLIANRTVNFLDIF